jgi:predicted anti-sigma-YlaC factor YlaD
MIGCSDFLAEIGKLLDGDVAAQLRAELENHLAHCQTCRVIYDSARNTVRIVTESGSFELPQAVSKAVTANVMARLREERSK